MHEVGRSLLLGGTDPFEQARDCRVESDVVEPSESSKTHYGEQKSRTFSPRSKWVGKT